MINLFRKVRQQLFAKNHFGKYLFYAMGEIILVVLGILIALQLDNLNDKNKIKIKEKKYLVAVKNELLNNLELLENAQNLLNENLAGQRKFIMLFDTLRLSIDENKISALITKSFGSEVKMATQSGVFNELINSGELKDISNDSIRSIISSWDGRLLRAKKQEDDVIEKKMNSLVIF